MGGGSARLCPSPLSVPCFVVGLGNDDLFQYETSLVIIQGDMVLSIYSHCLNPNENNNK